MPAWKYTVHTLNIAQSHLSICLTHVLRPTAAADTAPVPGRGSIGQRLQGLNDLDE